MNTADLLEHTLELVTDRIGDPAPLVYERLFASAPELRAMFVNDPRGSVRGEMFLRAIETMVDMARQRQYAEGMITSEWINHRMIGVTARQFDAFFGAIVQVLREALGSDWTADMEAAWGEALGHVGGVTERAAQDAATPV